MFADRSIFLIGFTLVVLYMGSKTEAAGDECLVKTQYGSIRGALLTNPQSNRTFCAYRGIPYAKSPTGSLRFKDPQSVTAWKDTYNAADYGPSCWAQSGAPQDLSNSEDCLSINVFVPYPVKPNASIPVVTFIYGGAFTKGLSNDISYGPEFLVDRDLIFITFNYRVGVFGFMAFGTNEYSGNMGLKDQRLALKWVHTQIKSFGGNPEQVTLMGHSAGSVSVHYHMLNDESRKYFKRAICLSGTALNYFARSEQPNHKKIIQEFANTLRNKTHNDQELKTFLETVTVPEILKNLRKFESEGRTLVTTWSPVIEHNHPGAFMTKKPEEFYANKKNKLNMDVIFSNTNLEWLFPPDVNDPKRIEDLNTKFELPLPFHDVAIAKDSQKYKTSMEQIKKYYFNGRPINNKTMTEYLTMLTDISFAYQINEAVKLQASHSTANTYYFRFSVIGKLSGTNRKLKDHYGAGHGEERCYIFRCKFMGKIYEDIFNTKDTDKESAVAYNTMQRLLDMVETFAKTGVPTLDKKPFTSDKKVVGSKSIQRLLDMGKSLAKTGTRTLDNKSLAPVKKADLIPCVDFTNDGLKYVDNVHADAYKLWRKIEDDIRKR